MRCVEGSIVRKVLINKPTVEGSRRRPRQRRQGRVNADLRMSDGTANIEIATDRDAWKVLIEAAKGLNGS